MRPYVYQLTTSSMLSCAKPDSSDPSPKPSMPKPRGLARTSSSLSAWPSMEGEGSTGESCGCPFATRLLRLPFGLRMREEVMVPGSF